MQQYVADFGDESDMDEQDIEDSGASYQWSPEYSDDKESDEQEEDSREEGSDEERQKDKAVVFFLLFCIISFSSPSPFSPPSLPPKITALGISIDE